MQVCSIFAPHFPSVAAVGFFGRALGNNVLLSEALLVLVMLKGSVAFPLKTIVVVFVWVIVVVDVDSVLALGEAVLVVVCVTVIVAHG
jgi:hypothetical protein